MPTNSLCLTTYHLSKKGNSSGYLLIFYTDDFLCFLSLGQSPTIQLSCNILHLQEILFRDEKFYHLNHLHRRLITSPCFDLNLVFSQGYNFPSPFQLKLIISPFQH